MKKILGSGLSILALFVTTFVISSLTQSEANADSTVLSFFKQEAKTVSDKNLCSSLSENEITVSIDRKHSPFRKVFADLYRGDRLTVTVSREDIGTVTMRDFIYCPERKLNRACTFGANKNISSGDLLLDAATWIGNFPDKVNGKVDNLRVALYLHEFKGKSKQADRCVKIFSGTRENRW
jgi:hypothetical protein